MNIVVLCGETSPAAALKDRDRASLEGAGHVVQVLGATPAVRRARVRVGRLGVNPGRWLFVWTVMGGRAGRQAVRHADVVVAADAAAVPAAWLVARRTPTVLALNGVPSAVTRLSGQGRDSKR